ADVPFPDRTELRARRHVRRLVAAVRRHAADVVRRAARFGQHGHNVDQRLLELDGDVLRLKFLLRVPTHLAGDENDPAGVDLDAVGVTDGRSPAFWKQCTHDHPCSCVSRYVVNRYSAADPGRWPSPGRAAAPWRSTPAPVRRARPLRPAAPARRGAPARWWPGGPALRRKPRRASRQPAPAAARATAASSNAPRRRTRFRGRPWRDQTGRERAAAAPRSSPSRP